MLHNLLEKNLVVIKGRSESVGRALQYATTDEFLKFFGLNTLEEIPEMSEIEELIRASDGDKTNEFNIDDGVGAVESVVKNGNDKFKLTLLKEAKPEV